MDVSKVLYTEPVLLRVPSVFENELFFLTSVYICTPVWGYVHMREGDQGDQKRASNPLELPEGSRQLISRVEKKCTKELQS